jgi:type IV pilus assembly protein PilA
MAQWFYVDKNQQRIGPMEANVLVDSLRQGQLGTSSMVWCEGMPAWQPLSMHFDALGVPEAMRIRKAPSGSNKGVWAIVLIVGGFFGIAILGILVAIALPAYQDYTIRAKVAEAMNKTAPLKLAVAEHMLSDKKCLIAEDAAAAAIISGFDQNSIQSVAIGSLEESGSCAFEITFGINHGLVAGKTMQFSADTNANNVIEWDCKLGTLEPRYRTAVCRP